MEEVAKASVAENVSLIKSIPEQYFKDITGAVMRSITTGNGLADLVSEIDKYAGQTKRRAENLALDQTRKAYNSINKQRMQAIGVRQFEWIHSGGGQVPRESHLKISGHIFDFDKVEEQQAALGVPERDRGIPGFPVNCRCTMLPVINFEQE
jgi:SPP1 gp7 family putative phage head morphogenesis protein